MSDRPTGQNNVAGRGLSAPSPLVDPGPPARGERWSRRTLRAGRPDRVGGGQAGRGGLGGWGGRDQRSPPGRRPGVQEGGGEDRRPPPGNAVSRKTDQLSNCSKSSREAEDRFRSILGPFQAHFGRSAGGE